MSLALTALRFAVIEALAPTALVETMAADGWPTLARWRVFDSSIPPEAATDAEARLPVIVVYSDDARVEPQGPGTQALFDGREHVTLACEIMVPIVEEGLARLGGSTDAMAEALVDTIAAQIEERLRRALMYGPLGLVAIEIEKLESRPWSDADTALRLAARRVEFSARVRRLGPFPEVGAGLSRLPEPLRAVAMALPEASYGRAIAEAIAAAITLPAAFDALQELRFAGNLARPSGEAAPPPATAAGTSPLGDVAGRILP